VHTNIHSAGQPQTPHHKGDPIALADLTSHERLPRFRLVRDDSQWIPTLRVYLHLEAVLPTHPQGGHFPKEIISGNAVCSSVFC